MHDRLPGNPVKNLPYSVQPYFFSRSYSTFFPFLTFFEQVCLAFYIALFMLERSVKKFNLLELSSIKIKCLFETPYPIYYSKEFLPKIFILEEFSATAQFDKFFAEKNPKIRKHFQGKTNSYQMLS